MRKAAPPLPPNEASRFSDMDGYVFSVDEPPTRFEAAGYLWRSWFKKEREEMPEAAEIDALLERLLVLYAEGKWRRA